jgi:hypothetical protein
VKYLLAAWALIAGVMANGPPPPASIPVLVELFTSEGCSSCPPADELLQKLLREQPVAGADIIAVAFHVDYWDRQGWKDPYSSKAFSSRQQDYTRIFGPDKLYTPQMVVDGRDEFVGSDESAARKIVASASQRKHLQLELDARVVGDGLRLSFDLPAAPAGSEPIDVMVAVVEDDLSSAVRRGENAGKTLSHVGVVRKLETSGALGPDSFVADGQIKLERAWNVAKLRAVIWLQGRNTRHVHGSASATIAR